ncbi:hypothetical protein EVAR_36082_1 [Eumeta japonica]|uniref:Uncharacterized protein n=1 Tax=Eumeta variegata TaxID=151549 RepID=A0A4C1YKF4_EUMVA|nr:hypothetical protein EVAR_36082_1 [Eumeta japonica]
MFDPYHVMRLRLRSRCVLRSIQQIELHMKSVKKIVSVEKIAGYSLTGAGLGRAARWADFGQCPAHHRVFRSFSSFLRSKTTRELIK